VCLDIANIKNRDVVQEQQNFTRIGNSSTRNDEYLVSFFVNAQQTSLLHGWKITKPKKLYEIYKDGDAICHRMRPPTISLNKV